MHILRWSDFPRRCVIIAGAILSVACSASLATAQSCTQLKVTAHPDYPPLSWVAGTTVDGSLIRVLERFSKAVKTPLVLEPAKSWEEAQRRTVAGEVDLILGLYRTPQREAELQFVERPVTTDPISVFVRKEQAEEIDDLGDLRSLKGAAAAGESFGADFDLRVAKQLVLFRTENLQAAFKFLVDKQADYVLSGLYPGLAHIRQLGPSSGIALTQAALIPSQPLYVAFSKKSACLSLAPALETMIEKMTSRGDMEGLTAEAMMRWTHTPTK